jgi:cytochrome c oxidase subunit 1
VSELFVDRFPDEARISRLTFATAFLALGIGAVMGLIQALNRTGVLEIVSPSDYYTVLTLHGVLLALVFTIFFLAGTFNWAMTRSLDRGVRSLRFSLAWYGMMVAGTAMAAVAMFGGFISEMPDLTADVLYTFYAPLEAHPIYYAGLALFLIGTWLAGVDWFRMWWGWRKDNPDERTPLQAFMVLTTMLMWYIGTIGLAVKVLVFMLPLSLGIVDTVNPLLTRTLFWYFGHMVVYFWLMPAYLLWYTVLPKIAGGRLFSDPLARVVFVLFLILSVPVGVHHQYLDPGIAEGFKFIAMTNTMFLLLPSLLTAFTVVASIEHGARQRGGEGYFGWLRALPWRNPAFTGMTLAGLMFAAGGFSGMVNAGMNLNYLVHNTIWVPGHFHLTVGTAVALTFMAGSYWLLPRITGREIYSQQIGLFQVVLWFVGMTLMSNAMHRAGLAGVPRRTADPTYEGFVFETPLGAIPELRLQIALGGVLLFVSTVLFLSIVMLSALDHKAPAATPQPLPEPLSGPEGAPKVLDNIKLWTAVAVLLVILAYSLPLAAIITDSGLFPEGIKAFRTMLSPLLGGGWL